MIRLGKDTTTVELNFARHNQERDTLLAGLAEALGGVTRSVGNNNPGRYLEFEFLTPSAAARFKDAIAGLEEIQPFLRPETVEKGKP